MIGIAKQHLPVELSFASEKPMTFTATLEFIDEDGNRFGYVLGIQGLQVTRYLRLL